jgi:hypothetical protein
MKDIENAINHFKWKFTQSNSKASNKDKTSLNVIINALNEQSNAKLSDNLNFCKLFVFTFNQMVLKNSIKNNYEFIEFELIYNKLKDALKLDASEHIEELYKELKQIQIQNLINQNKLTNVALNNLTTKKDVELKTRRMLSEFIKNN